MSSTPTPSANGLPEDAEPSARMPTSLRVAVIVLSVLAALLLMNAGLTWLGREQVVDALMENNDISRADARQFVVTGLIPYVLLGLLMATAAWFLPRRRRWARFVGLAASTFLAVLTLFFAIVGGGVTIGSLLLLVLSIAAVTSLLARSSSTWVPARRRS